MTAVYIVLSRCRSRRPMLASKICDIQRTDYSIDSSMRARAIQMVPIRTVTSPQRPNLPSVEAHCASPATTSNARLALIKSMKPNVVLP